MAEQPEPLEAWALVNQHDKIVCYGDGLPCLFASKPEAAKHAAPREKPIKIELKLRVAEKRGKADAG